MDWTTTASVCVGNMHAGIRHFSLTWQDDGQGLLVFGQTFMTAEEVGLACVVDY